MYVRTTLSGGVSLMPTSLAVRLMVTVRVRFALEDPLKAGPVREVAWADHAAAANVQEGGGDPVEGVFVASAQATR